MKNILLVIVSTILFSFSQAQNTPKLIISECSTPPIIDGIADENDPWTDSWIPLDKSAKFNKTSAMSAYFQIKYDFMSLYLIAKILDTNIDTFNNGSWDADGLTLYLCLDTLSGTSGTYKSGDFIMTQGRGYVFPDGYIDRESGVNGVTTVKNHIKIVQVDGELGYFQEWQIPWNALERDIQYKWDGKYFKLDLNATDNTTGNSRGRTQVQFWNSNSDLQYNDKRYLGLVQLEHPILTTSIVGGYNKAIVCGEETQLSVLTNFNNTEILSYLWSPSTGLSQNDISNPIANIKSDKTYYVTITGLDGQVAIDSVKITVNTLAVPSICMVSVGEDNKNIVVWEKPIASAVDSFLIYRESLSQTDTYELIGAIPSSTQSVFIDSFSNALIQSNKYRIAAKDICGFITDQSATHKTMHLNINKGQDNIWNLIWEPYEGFTISSYQIYRGTSRSDFIKIGSASATSISYSDIYAPLGNVYYQIEVMASHSCSTKKSTTYSSSRSNIATNSINSISSTIGNNYLNIYPVPVKEVLYFNSNLSSTYNILVLTIDGRIIMSIKHNKCENKMDVSNLLSGVYILRLSDNKVTLSGRFIKE